MTNCGLKGKIEATTVAKYGLIGIGAGALMLGLVAFPAPRTADALPAYAQQTGFSCGQCHVSAGGGGALTKFGKSFAANGHKVPAGAAPSAPSVHVRSDTFFLDWPKLCNGWCPGNYD